VEKSPEFSAEEVIQTTTGNQARRTVPGLNRTNFRREGSEIYTCDVCDEKFYSDVSLATHNADYHSTLLCDICDESICGVIEFITHKHSHSSKPGRMGGDAVRCVLCNMEFVTNQALKYHLYKHADIKPYKCTVCSEMFRTPSTLKGHFQVQHSVSKHKCSVCGLQSSTSGKLKIHMRSHTMEKPFQCTYCDISFKQSSVLKLHEFTHSPKSKFQCDQCFKCFPIKSKFMQHMKRPKCPTKISKKPLTSDAENDPKDGLFFVECLVEDEQIHSIDDHQIL